MLVRRVPSALGGIIFPLSVYMLSVSLVAGIAVLTASSPFGAGEVIIPSYTDMPELSATERILLGPWWHWDGMWYLKIATHGYAYDDHSLAFFPAYPFLIRLVGDALRAWRALPTAYLLSAILISAVSYLVGLVFLYKLAALDHGKPFARRSVLYLCIFPSAFFFLAVYTESLFLALSVAAFYCARKGTWIAAVPLGMAAALTRSTGLLLLVPFVIEYLSQREFKLRRVGLGLGAVLLIPVGTALYSLYAWLAFGDALGFIAAQDFWQRSLAFPWDTLGAQLRLALTESNPELLPPPSPSPIWQILKLADLPSGHAVSLAFFVLAAILFLCGFPRLRISYAVYTALALLVPLANPSQLMPLLSIPRFVLVLFPLAFILAHVGENRFVHALIVASFSIALIVLTVRFAAGYWVA